MNVSFPALFFYYFYQFSPLLFSRRCGSQIGISRVNNFFESVEKVKNQSQLNLFCDFRISPF